MNLRPHLIIFARAPRFGAGKKRLAKGVGAVEALRFQRVMLAQTVRRLASDRRWTTWLAVTPDRSGPWPARILVIPQGAGDLGARMARAARRPPPGPVLIVGVDIPGISSTDIARGFRLLGSCDAVFGPAADGGYWAVGLRRRPRFIDPFRNVRWSSPSALADTLKNLDGASIGFLPLREDIDDAAALARARNWETVFLHAPGKTQQQPPPS